MTPRTMTAPPQGGAWLLSTQLVREGATDPGLGELLRGPHDAARIMGDLYGSCPQEVFVTFILNTRHRVVGVHEVCRGIMDASLVHPREILRPAILANAAALIVAHNHPSGDPSPSREDRAVTRELGRAARAVGIPLLDHLVIGWPSGNWISLADEIGKGEA